MAIAPQPPLRQRLLRSSSRKMLDVLRSLKEYCEQRNQLVHQFEGKTVLISLIGQSGSGMEECRAAIVDSLVLYLINRNVVNADQDFEYHDGGCYLNDTGRKKYLRAFLQRMEEQLQSDNGKTQPRWDLLNQQIKAYKQFVYHPTELYKPHLIR